MSIIHSRILEHLYQAALPNIPNTQPEIVKPKQEHPAYTENAKEYVLAQTELLKQQEELERKADN